MVLDTIFKSDEPVTPPCVSYTTSDNKDPDDEVNNFIEYVKHIIANFNKRITALEESKPEPVKKTENTPKNKNSLKSPMKSRNPDKESELNWELKNDGTVGSVNRKIGKMESFTLLKLFKKVDFPIKNRDYPVIKSLLAKESVSLQIGMTLIYNLNIELERGRGRFLNILYEIYSNEYSTPAYLNFKIQNKQVTINDVETGIKPFQVKQWIDDINTGKPMVKIMKENQKLSQKYLWYILNYHDRKELLEVL